MIEKISVIIPASNEERLINQIISSYKKQNYQSLEIVVVVNNSVDNTYQIALQKAHKVLNFNNQMSVGEARNRGARVASGEIFVFSDADTYLTEGALNVISTIKNKNAIIVPLGKAIENSVKAKLFIFYKNLFHRLGLKSAIFGVICCRRDFFFKVNGFDSSRKIAEYSDFIKRAMALGGEYVLINSHYAVTSLRRFEKNGYLKEYLFWIKWRIASWFGKAAQLEEKYFKNSHFQIQNVQKNKIKKWIKGDNRSY